jgi:putative flavoprotein involved in K+ transport
MPGLYFLGLPWQHTRGSTLLGWVKDDAHYIAEHIAGFTALPEAHGDEGPPRWSPNSAGR